jgi:spore germination protein Q
MQPTPYGGFYGGAGGGGTAGGTAGAGGYGGGGYAAQPSYQYSQQPAQFQSPQMGGGQMGVMGTSAQPYFGGAGGAGAGAGVAGGTGVPGGAFGGVPPSIGQQQFPQTSYIENILRLNAGKVATIYMSFENNSQWANKVFTGVIEAAGKDHIILRDQNSTKRYLLLMIYVDYITFDSEINYFYGPAPQFFSVASP